MKINSVYRDFWLFFVATGLSILSLDIFVFNQGWFLLEIGGKRPDVGFTWGLFFLPGLVMLPLIKKFTESRRLRLGLLLSEALKSLIFLACLYVIRHVRTVEAMYIAMVLLGCAFAPFYPMSYSVLKKLFQDKSVVRFSNLTEVAIQIAGVVAMFASGFILKSFGFFTLTAMALGASTCAVVLFAVMKIDNLPDADVAGVMAKTKGSSILKGISPVKMIFGFLHTYPQVSVLLLNIPLLLYVEQIMKKGPIEYGILDALCAGAAIVSSSIWAYFSKASASRQTLLVTGLLSTGCYLISAYVQPTASIWPFLLFALLGFLSTSAKLMARGQLMLTHTAEEVARYNPIYQFASNLTLVLGAFFFGYVIKVFSIESCLAILGFGYLLFSVAANFIIGQIKD